MQITLIRPDDWHLHLRDDEAMASVVAHSAERFARAIVMPNLKPPVTTTAMAIAYRERILAALPQNSDFKPLMTLYMTDRISSDEVIAAKQSGIVNGIKLYPAGATTHSDAGVTDIRNCYPALETMQKEGLPLLIHAEVTDPEVDIFDREQVFIDRHLQPLARDFPALPMVFEHITTRQAVDFIRATEGNIAATITVQHLMYNRNAMLVGGIRPHYYCLPILKRESHQSALIEAATSGEPHFFLGTDSAPHPQHAKECACGCAGCYTAHAAIELYAEVFERADALDRLEGFASLFGPDFYGLPRNRDRITLEKRPWKSPDSYQFGQDRVVPLGGGEMINWQLVA
ncbi:MAG: dihydroorotase [gamma proteobacterium symbiont of Ctena orbiculata]|uniref:Dihydroorotase n=1 Tax=Candidatus Thiodiazotropha taylori TaxID=2792791 RepID=A0A944MAI8_9GAMM|nr:dihydroorotase [Candidatus Thiodiazotropha taylori]PUB86657.1 MAG: dihydroorotase [gamma proteobacterium symbiont of Ctena orbiculata]MBT2987837.1 dihydroorotase [Candidatus Thiodiazotropha taylori]MBT2995776.1 dihydroorotase [Candidatus Thiodiazotropha taylori]MBT2999091.1 dihydroorotase [Candidatus Thiodiazotropha taylori]